MMSVSIGAATTAITGGIQLAQFIAQVISTARAQGTPLSPEQEAVLFSSASNTIAAGKAAWKAGGETEAAKAAEGRRDAPYDAIEPLAPRA